MAKAMRNAQQHVPDTAEGLPLQRSGKEAQEPLRAHKEEVELVSGEGHVHTREPLTHKVLQHSCVRTQLSHAVGVPSAGTELAQQVLHRQKSRLLIPQHHDEDGGEEVQRLAITELGIAGCEGPEDPPELVRSGPPTSWKAERLGKVRKTSASMSSAIPRPSDSFSTARTAVEASACGPAAGSASFSSTASRTSSGA
eukprot:CAMPEP_0180640208 /NCGR_PEP_ID=MMETSP1037_2-20121125/45595_1 /TAXON_ID=632150 /ORGANISM="Azadinium spinosum, Strain 3D9" /LENGTH=196 /DNA_ID=CAMNT_0022662507 /DNA_START=157 /DNA_END=743 /DNA_ORIENTATION=-